jgi:hypothetical protein
MTARIGTGPGTTGAVKLTLPYPPSLNHYWRAVPGSGVLISRGGRVYRRSVAAAVSAARLRRCSCWCRLQTGANATLTTCSSPYSTRSRLPAFFPTTPR